MKNKTPGSHTSTTRRLFFGAVFLLLIGLAGGWLVHAYVESQRIIKTDTEPAAQLKRDDTLKGKSPKLFLKVNSELVEPSRHGEDTMAAFVTELVIDREKCLDYYGDDGLMQCQLRWSTLNPARAQWQIAPSIPQGEWKFDPQSKRYTAHYLFDPENSTSGKDYTITLPQDLGDAVVVDSRTVKFASPPFQPLIAQWKFQSDPEDPAKNIISGEMEFGWAVDPQSLEQRVSFAKVLNDAEKTISATPGASLGTPVFTYSADGRTVGLVVEVLELPATSEVLNIIINPGVMRKHGGGSSPLLVQAGTTVPGKDVFVSLSKATSLVTTDKENLSRQVLTLEFTRPVKVRDIQNSTKAVLLPRHESRQSQNDEEPTDWSAYVETSLVFQNALKQSADRLLPLKPIDSATEYSNIVSFQYEIPAEYRNDPLGSGCFFYLTNDGGAASTAGLPLAPFARTVQVAPLEKELYIMQKGSILSLNASKTLAIFSRGLNTVTLNAWQVRPEFINLLTSHSYGDIGDIDLDSFNFNFSHLAEKRQLVYHPVHTDSNSPNYHALDLSPLFADGGKGLFRLELQGSGLTDEGKQSSTTTYQSQFLLVTDLALNIKREQSGERRVFINSFASGAPTPGVKVDIIGRNGLSLFTAHTDEAGMVAIPDTDGFKHEKQAVALVAVHGEDYTFMPLYNHSRHVSYDRFGNIAGWQVTREGLRAFAFAERDIFRPGEELRFGGIIKNTTWTSDEIEGLPLQVQVMNPRMETVYKKPYVQNSSGLLSVTVPTHETDPTGLYSLDILLDDIWIGGTTVHVEEFQPETIRLDTSFNKVPPSGFKGWVVPEDLNLKATVNNLYGTPAVGNTVNFFYSLTPTRMAFSEYEGFRFFDPGTNTREYTSSPQKAETDERGQTEFAIDFKGYASGSYLLRTVTEAFEAGGGRSVTKFDTIPTSPHTILVGWKSDADVAYIEQDSAVTVNFIAVDNTLAPAALDNLNILVSEATYVSSLVKTESGSYRYDNVRRLTERLTTPAAIPESGFNFVLPTDRTGEFEISLKNRDGLEICNMSYVVAGGGQRVYGLERDVNLRVHLDRPEYNGGDEMQIFISAPYAGTGLITVESDKIHAAQWFTATTSDSVQRITVPDTIEGRAFVNVSLVRDIHSDAVYSTPFAYAVAPFMGNLQRRNQNLVLETPEKVAPGDTLTMRVSAEKPGKALVFAVDEGILQLTNYTSPSPLVYFLKEKSLTVSTMQNWDLIMPEYHLIHSVFGGGVAAPMNGFNTDFINPFRRKGEPAVVYWSGLIDVDSAGTNLEWKVPSYFNGSLRIMAVSSGDTSIGDTFRHTTVRGPLVISPDLPVAVAPGDEFEVTAAIANNIEGSGENLEIALDVTLDDGLVFVREPQSALRVNEQDQGRIHFRLKATERLGESTVNLVATASVNDEEVIVKRPISLSIRPASPKISAFKAGVLKNKEQTIPIGRTLYPEFAEIEASVSGLPLPMVDALSGFLTTFPHGCTEQVLSAAFPYAVLNKSPELLPVPADMTPAELKEHSEKAIQRGLATLREREILPGRFSLWPYENSYGYSFLTAYALDYLITAKEAGFTVPQTLIDSTQLETLRILQGTPRSKEAMQTMVYAAWVYTRSGKTLTELPRLVKGLDANIKDWKQSPLAALVAACYQMMHQDKEAAQLLKSAKAIDSNQPAEAAQGSWFTSRLWENSLLLTAYTEAFPDQLNSREAQKALVYIINDVMSGAYTTSSAAQATRAIAGYAMANMAQNPQITLEARDNTGQTLTSNATGTHVKRLVTARGDAEQSQMDTHAFHMGGGKGLYWQITTNGFDKKPLPPLSKKLLVTAEYIPVDDKPLAELAQGDEVYVLLRGKATQPIDNVAITSLLPGGFEMVISKGGVISGSEAFMAQHYQPQSGNSPRDLDGPASYPNEGQVAALRSMLDEAEISGQAMPVVHAERREDRMVVFTSLGLDERLFIYRIKAINKGKFTLPAVSATALYDPDARANTQQGSIEVK